MGKPSGFDTYLLQYRELFSRLQGFQVIYVAADERMFCEGGGYIQALVWEWS
jgi:hypothetical protein